MSHFLTEDFLLHNEPAKHLYHHYAKHQPIFDYHCHLSPKEIADDRQFENLTQIWLAGDHYKWRALRTAGIAEVLITGQTSDKEKYDAWAKVVPLTIGNPLYHWTHLELRRPFGIHDTVFGPQTAEKIWLDANELLTKPEFSARGILKQMNVKMVGTTDDPVSSLSHHQRLKEDKEFDVAVLPSFRPDRVFKIELEGFSDYLQKLSEAANVEITDFPSLLTALTQRLDHFAALGCVAADHGIEHVRFATIPSQQALSLILQKRLQNHPLSELEIAQFFTAVNVWLGQEYANRGWAMQLHIGAQRNNNSRYFAQLGADSGFDSMGDKPYAFELARLLDEMDKTNQLPKTILYCLNPRDNEMLATMTGNFQGGGIAGKVQFGSGWWFNDQKDGMQRQLQQLSQLGLLSQFIGMLTDSRSFLSYTRHEYFRRILCNMMGSWVQDGEVPDDMELLGNMVSNICFNNAARYFSRQ